ncbi:MAG: NACHT domain-containing protein, partial [Phormidesmis sp. CAN_BIN44]|nr:NACHT domain-containing protein [Phormidesmis sp. CAN_BIN44]
EWRLLEALSEELSTDNRQTQTLLEQGRLLILMDGLDEVPTNSFRRNVQEQLRSLAQEPKHSGNQFILTCRTQIIEVIPQGFTSVEVADFDNEQVKKFVENWFCASGQNEAEIAQQWQAFSDATKKNPALNELTVTPVLLSLMCWVFQDTGELPSQAASLYGEGIRLLLEKWNDRKEIDGWEVGKEVYRKLDLEQKEALLTEIAVRKFENPENFVLFEQKDLAKQIANFLNLANVREGEAVLRAMEAQHGLLVERADKLWSFSHLTFQAYFTARTFENSNCEGLVKHITDEKWREVFLLTVNMRSEADSLVQQMKQKIDAFLAEDKAIQHFLTWVKEKSNSVGASYKPAAIRAFYLALSREFFSDWNPSPENRFFSSSFGRYTLENFILAPELDQQLRESLNRDSVWEYIVELLSDLLDLERKYEQTNDETWDDYDRHYNVIQTAKSEIETLELKIDDLFDRFNSPNRDLDSELHYDLLISDSFFTTYSGMWFNFSDVLFPCSGPYMRYPATPIIQADPEFREAMKELFDDIHCNFWSDEDRSLQSTSTKWWTENGQNWISQLRAILIEHRNIGHDWKFSDVQKETLRQYYDANKLLIDCLNSGCAVSDRTRQEIEDDLLLPIAELKRRLPDHYS